MEGAIIDMNDLVRSRQYGFSHTVHEHCRRIQCPSPTGISKFAAMLCDKLHMSKYAAASATAHCTTRCSSKESQGKNVVHLRDELLPADFAV